MKIYALLSIDNQYYNQPSNNIIAFWSDIPTLENLMSLNILNEMNTEKDYEKYVELQKTHAYADTFSQYRIEKLHSNKLII